MTPDNTNGSANPEPGDRLEVALHGMAHGGEAVGRSDAGRVVFVEGGLPGETVHVELTEVQSRYARGRMVAEPESSSPGRIDDPRCPHFGAWPERGQSPERFCGACQWQHARYTAQLAYKRDILADALQRIGRLSDPPVLDAIGMEDPWGYRNHIRLHASADGLGYHAVDGETIMPVEVCPITHPLVTELLPLVEGQLPEGTEVSLRAGINTGDQLIVLHGEADIFESIDVTADISVILERGDASLDVVAGLPFLTESLAGRTFQVPATGFFQVNTVMAEVLVDLLRDILSDNTGLLVDIHSGVGTFGILLADLCEEVYVIENHAPSVAAAVNNAGGLENVTLLEADAAEGLAFIARSPDVVVLDPPRSGVDAETIRLLVEFAPSTIAYVSCEPSTLARDAKQLVGGGYRLVSSQPVDMFPQTFHVESINLFRRKEG